MISFEKAMEIIMTDVRTTGSERVDFNEALYRILVEDVFSDVDMPPFNKSAVDGYACRFADLQQPLHVLEVIAAGSLPSRGIGPGECIKVMTGAMVPEGADTVIMVEDTEETEAGVIRFTSGKTATNIAWKAEDVKNGDKVLEKGLLIMPQHLAIMASVGCVNPLVARQPHVAVLSTGDELVEPYHAPRPGSIRNSNGFQLAAQVKDAHCLVSYLGIIPDNEQATQQAISHALENFDMVILSGGVSMGDFDFVPRIMKQNNVEILFRKVAVKPGRPTVFGRTHKSYIFGLPGNPVSSFINFEIFAKPLLYRMMGHNHQPGELSLPLAMDLVRKKADRMEWLPVKFSGEGSVIPVNYHGSAHIHALSLAQGLMCIPQGISEIKKGAPVHVRPI